MDKLIESMIAAASKALPNAYAPYSKFKVASCILTTQGNVYTGVNVENGSFGLTSCAEASAISKMITAGEQKIKSIVILANNNLLCPPCGGCRQRIYEFATAKTCIHLCSQDSVLHSIAINELLPLAFDFKP